MAIYNVVDYGADDTGVASVNAAVQDAIDACHAALGGTVWFPAGTFRFTNYGPVLYSDIEVAGIRGASILRGDYPQWMASPDDLYYFFRNNGAGVCPDPDFRPTSEDWRTPALRDANITIRDLTFRGAGRLCLTFANADNILVTTCDFISQDGAGPGYNSFAGAVIGTGAITGFTVTDCYLENCRFGIMAWNGKLTEVQVHPDYEAMRDVTFARNTVLHLGNGTHDDQIFAAPAFGDMYTVLIEDNVVQMNPGTLGDMYGIVTGLPWAPYGDETYNHLDSVTIRRNTVTSLNQDDENVLGILVYCAPAGGSTRLIGVVIEDNVITNCARSGVVFNNTCHNPIVRRNTVTGCRGQLARSLHVGYCFAAEVSANTVTDWSLGAVSAIDAPGVVTLTEGTGGIVWRGTWEFYVVAVDAGGLCSAPGPAAQITITSVTDTATIGMTWDAVDDAVSYRVYGYLVGAADRFKATAGNSLTWGTVGFTTESQIDRGGLFAPIDGALRDNVITGGSGGSGIYLPPETGAYGLPLVLERNTVGAVTDGFSVAAAAGGPKDIYCQRNAFDDSVHDPDGRLQDGLPGQPRIYVVP